MNKMAVFAKPRQVSALVGVHVNTLWDWLNPNSARHDSTFPLPRRLSKSSVVFRMEEVQQWIEARPLAPLRKGSAK